MHGETMKLVTSGLHSIKKKSRYRELREAI